LKYYLWIISFATLLLNSGFSLATEQAVYGPRLEGFSYPYPVQYFTLRSQQQELEMAYLDVPAAAATANGKTIVLMHGKNFCAATWDGSIKALSAAGYRVVTPDQIGFCKSSKPQQYQFSFQQLAANTKALLDQLKIDQVAVMGHSMGGMLATRFALQYPDTTDTLIMVNPIGLEDWKAVGVPYRTVDEWYQRDLKTTAEGIRNYQRNTYYAGQWRDDFEPWVQMRAGMYRGKGREQVAWNSALTADMIYSQPVIYEFPLLSMPVILLIGDKDNTAIGKDAAPEALRPTLGNYAKLGPAAAEAIPNANLVRFADLGHSPHIQAPERFHQALLQALNRQ
tara:strand:+ start:970 stop:1983 length:1014 start_codon:yes stop_codon:yes gene_type:complete